MAVVVWAIGVSISGSSVGSLSVCFCVWGALSVWRRCRFAYVSVTVSVSVCLCVCGGFVYRRCRVGGGVVAAMVASVVVGGTVVAVVLAADATAGVAGVWCWGLVVIVRISLDAFFDEHGRKPCKMPWE
jgi:hypothetical protein